MTGYRVKKVKVTTRAAGQESIDAAGLLVPAAEEYAYNGFNQLLSVSGNDGSTTTFGYDDNGNQVSKRDGSGLTQYVYNPDNRLVGIALPGGGANAFEYDANGLRTKKTDSAGTTRYLLDGMSVVGEYAPDGSRQAWYTQSLARLDEVLSVVNGQGKYWYQADALGSAYALTTANGAVAARGGYDVFGAAVPVSGSVGQPFGFTGREHELDSALVYARARYLQPATGTWNRADPYSVEGLTGGAIKPVLGVVPFDLAGRSGYEYPLPTLRADPHGLWVFGLGLGAGFIFLTGGFELVAYVVVDGHGGLGILVVPALRVGLAVGGDASVYGFWNPMANTMLKGVILGVLLFMLLGGIATMKIAAAREVSRGDPARLLQALVWTGWLKGDTRRAIVLRRLALAWVLVLVVAWLAVAVFMKA